MADAMIKAKGFRERTPPYLAGVQDFHGVEQLA